MRKNHFNINKNFIVRTPFLPYDSYLNNLKDINRASLEDVNNLNFHENLTTLSNGLMNCQSKKLESVEKTNLKYLIRSSTRTTPYGLSSSLIKGSFDNDTHLMLKNYYKKVHPDTEWMLEVVKKLENELYDHLKVKVNNTLSMNNHTIYNEWPSCFSGESNSNNTQKNFRINNTLLVKYIIELCGNFILTSDLEYKLITQWPEFSKDKFRSIIKQLLKSEFLISNIRPSSMVGNELNYILNQLTSSFTNSKIKQALLDIKNMIEQYENVEIGEGTNIYNKIIEKMSCIHKCNNYLHIDLYNDGLLKLGYERIPEIQEYCNLLLATSILPNYYEYVAAFKDRFSYGPVKMLDVIDPFNGIGFFKENEMYYLKKEDSFQKIIMSQIIEGKHDYIDLKCFVENDFFKNTNNILPKHFEISFYVLKNLLVVSNVKGKKQGHVLNGRFDFENYNRDVSEVEISFAPKNNRLANVMPRNVYGNCVFEFGTYTDFDDVTHIKLDDIYMVCENDILKFIDIKTGRKIKFKFYSALVKSHIPPLLNYMTTISYMNESNPMSLFELIEKVFENQLFIPEMRFENIIVSPKSWRIPSSLYLHNKKCIPFEKFKDNIIVYFKENKIPNNVQVGDIDRYIFINIENELHLKILFDELKKNSNILLKKVYFELEDLTIFDDKNNRYLGEYIFEIENMDEKESIDANHEKIVSYDIHPTNPFNKWIYLNLYCDERELDHVLVNFIFPLYKELLLDIDFNKLFYIRYRDLKPHIRLRIHHQNSTKIIQIIFDMLNELEKSNILKEYQILPYYKEYQRYGDSSSIELAEQFFSKDSFMVMNILELMRNKLINLDKVSVYVLSVFKTLNDLDVDFITALNHFENRLGKNTSAKKMKKLYANLELFLLDIPYWKMLRSEQHGENIYTLFCLSTDSLQQYWYTLKENNFSENKLWDIFFSLMHMRFNRLVGIDRELEDDTIALISNLLYKLVNRSNRIKTNE